MLTMKTEPCYVSFHHFKMISYSVHSCNEQMLHAWDSEPVCWSTGPGLDVSPPPPHTLFAYWHHRESLTFQNWYYCFVSLINWCFYSEWLAVLPADAYQSIHLQTTDPAQGHREPIPGSTGLKAGGHLGQDDCSLQICSLYILQKYTDGPSGNLQVTCPSPWPPYYLTFRRKCTPKGTWPCV